MRTDKNFLMSLLLCLAAIASRGDAQTAADGQVLGATSLLPTAALKITIPAGRIRLVAWDRDSILVRGHLARPERFYFGGDAMGVKLAVEDQTKDRSDFAIYLPRRVKVLVKTVTASIDGAGISGELYSVSGAIHLSGTASSIEVESMNGSLDLDVTTPWMRARTGDGHLLLRGAPLDVDAGTIGGTLDIASESIVRGQFTSVSGDIHYVGSPAPGGIFEFSNHSGVVDMLLPRNASGAFSLSSVVGPIENRFSSVRPAASPPHALHLTLGRGGASVTVRTFKGAIRLRSE